jgi:HK97 family phage major capsid protein
VAGIDINRTSDGVLLPPTVASEIWSTAVESSTVMQVARQVQLPGPGITVPMVLTDPEAEWVDETDEKPVDRPTIGNKAMTPYKLSVIVPFSDEFKRDLASLYAELVRRLPAALGRKFDETVYGLHAAPGSNFDTLAGSPTMTMDATNTFGDTIAVINALAAEGADLSAWVAGPALYGLLLSSTDAFGRQVFSPSGQPTREVGSVLGAPVYKTRVGMQSGAGATSDIIGVAGDWANSAVWGSVQGIQVSVSDQATITDGANQINLWQRNMSAVRAEVEVGFRCRDDQHFIRLNDGSAD